MPLSCRLAGECQNFVNIIVKDHKYHPVDGVDDANWLACELEVSVPPFRGSLNADLTTSDFEMFLQELKEFIKGERREVVFLTLEDNLNIRLIMSSKGDIEVKGVISETGDSTKLHFSFDTDSTFIDKLISELKTIVKRFPRIQK